MDAASYTESTKGKEESVNKLDCDATQETRYLESNGVGKVVRKREKDDSGFTDIDDINWDKL